MRVNFFKSEAVRNINWTNIMYRRNVRTASNADRADFQTTWGVMSDCLKGIVGEFTKEDLKRANKIKEKYLINNSSLLQLFNEKRKEFAKAVTKLPAITSKTVSRKEMYCVEPRLLPRNTQKRLKEKTVELYGVKQAIYNDNARCSKTPYSEWFDTPLQIQNSTLSKTQFMHPVDMVREVVGGYNAYDCERYEKYYKKYSEKSIEEIWKLKLEILKKISRYTAENRLDFASDLNKKECKRLKNLYIKFNALNDIQKRYGYFTKDFENVYFSQKITADSLKKGDYLNGLGLVINKLKVDDKPVLITFFDNLNVHVMNMLDLGRLTLKNKFLEKLNSEVSVKEAGLMNDAAKYVIEMDEGSKIARIAFNVLDSKRIDNKRVHKILSGYKSVYYISDFVNMRKIEYPTAAKILGVRLLNLLKEKNALPIVIQAQAFSGSTHSPVSMYMRLGFEPVSYSKKSVLNNMDKNKGRYNPNRKVTMYIDDFEKINERLQLLNSVYFPKPKH